MELKDFIQKTLQDITDGIQAGNEHMKEKHSYVSSRFQFDVDFEIHVTSEDNTSSGGGGKVNVANVISMGLDKGSYEKNITLNKISFKLPVFVHTGRPTDY